mgnify:FL=1
MNNLIWEATLDNGAYRCEVKRLSHHKGQLTVVETATNELILNKEVGLSYGAQFGPDMADVAQWQEMIVEAVDNP